MLRYMYIDSTTFAGDIFIVSAIGELSFMKQC